MRPVKKEQPLIIRDKPNVASQDEIDRVLKILVVKNYNYKETAAETGYNVDKIRNWYKKRKSRDTEKKLKAEKAGKVLPREIVRSFDRELQHAYEAATQRSQGEKIESIVKERLLLEEARRIKGMSINLMDLIYAAKIKTVTRMLDMIPDADDLDQLSKALVTLQSVEKSENPDDKEESVKAIIDVLRDRYNSINLKVEDTSYTHVDQQGNEIRVEAEQIESDEELITEEDY